MILSLLVVISVDSAATYLRQEALLSRDGAFFGLPSYLQSGAKCDIDFFDYLSKQMETV